jgi:hypothetical protein
MMSSRAEVNNELNAVQTFAIGASVDWQSDERMLAFSE